MAETILSHPFFIETVLPFLLVFTLVFAVLQKTKILGDGKKQIDALVALAIGLTVVSFAYATGIILSIIPFLAVSAVVILVFMLLYGMAFTGGDFKLHWGVQTTIGIIVAIGLIVTVMLATGAWDFVVDSLESNTGSSVVIVNLVFIVFIIIAVVAALFGGKK